VGQHVELQIDGSHASVCDELAPGLLWSAHLVCAKTPANVVSLLLAAAGDNFQMEIWYQNADHYFQPMLGFF
jgi:hypothetical protein